MKINNKGISPLIAAVILIGLTVALSAVVTNWGFGFIKQATENTQEQTRQSLQCVNDLSFKITDVDCPQNKLAIDNRGITDILKITFRIHKGSDIVPLTEEGVQALGKKIYSLDLSGAKKIEAIATIKGEEGKPDVTCYQAVEEYAAAC